MATSELMRPPAAVPDETGAAAFSVVRPRLLGIAHRVLGSANDADDVVQDAWIRWQGTDRGQIRDPAGFLITMTTRLAITAGQSARARREIASEPLEVDTVARGEDPSQVAEQCEALDRALLVLLERLSSTERAAYVLREAFEYPHRRIAELLGLSEANVRQIVTRARTRLRGERRRVVDASEHRRLVDTFVIAARNGDLPSLERLLAADRSHARTGRRATMLASHGRRPSIPVGPRRP